MSMKIAALPLVIVTALAGCGAGIVNPDRSDPREPATVCAQQAHMAQAGRTDGRPISITCPDGTIGSHPGGVYQNEYNRNADMYRAGTAAMIAVGTAR